MSSETRRPQQQSAPQHSSWSSGGGAGAVWWVPTSSNPYQHRQNCVSSDLEGAKSLADAVADVAVPPRARMFGRVQANGKRNLAADADALVMVVAASTAASAAALGTRLQPC
mgnify:CR=1 FL=1